MAKQQTDNGTIETDDPPERLRKVPGKVKETLLEIIMDAISLKRARMSHLDRRPTEGELLTMICAQWMEEESARLSGKGVRDG